MRTKKTPNISSLFCPPLKCVLETVTILPTWKILLQPFRNYAAMLALQIKNLLNIFCTRSEISRSPVVRISKNLQENKRNLAQKSIF